MRFVRIVGLCLGLFAACYGQRGRVDVRGDFGWTGFLDEGGDHHVLAGASLNAYLTTRLSLQPEFQYLKRTSSGFSDDHYDLVLLANVAYDFRSPGSRIVPYVIAGPGLIHSHDRFFSINDYYVTGGGGVKVFLTDRLYVAPDVRIGWEPHTRFSVGVGYVLRR